MTILEQTPTTTAVLVDEHGVTPRGPLAVILALPGAGTGILLMLFNSSASAASLGQVMDWCSNRGDEASRTVQCLCSSAMHGAEAQHNRGNNDGDCTENDLRDVLLARSFQLAK